MSLCREVIERTTLIDFLVGLDLSVLYYNVYRKCTTNHSFRIVPFQIAPLLPRTPKISTFI